MWEIEEGIPVWKQFFCTFDMSCTEWDMLKSFLLLMWFLLLFACPAVSFFNKSGCCVIWCIDIITSFITAPFSIVKTILLHLMLSDITSSLSDFQMTYFLLFVFSHFFTFSLWHFVLGVFLIYSIVCALWNNLKTILFAGDLWSFIFIGMTNIFALISVILLCYSYYG